MIILMMSLSEEEQTKINQIFALYFKYIYYMALKILNNERLVDDCVQDTFERIIRYIDSIGEVDSYITRAYIKKVVNSSAMTILKKESIRRQMQDIDDSRTHIAELVQNSTEITVIKNENRKRAACILQSLNPEEQILLWYRYYLKKSYKEIADIFGISENSCSTRMTRLLQKIRRQLEV